MGLRAARWRMLPLSWRSLERPGAPRPATAQAVEELVPAPVWRPVAAPSLRPVVVTLADQPRRWAVLAIRRSASRVRLRRRSLSTRPAHWQGLAEALRKGQRTHFREAQCLESLGERVCVRDGERTQLGLAPATARDLGDHTVERSAGTRLRVVVCRRRAAAARSAPRGGATTKVRCHVCLVVHTASSVR